MSKILSCNDYEYLYGQLRGADKKLPKVIYDKIMSGEEFTDEEETTIKGIIDADRETEGVALP